MLRIPYQHLARCGGILIAARGSAIDCFSIVDLSFLSTWKCLPEETKHAASTPPAKKRKISPSGDSELANNTKKINSRSEAVISGFDAPAITALTATKDGHHVICVTGEDKSIRVLRHVREENKYYLEQISQRIMPKRPCALSVSQDGNRIVVADKFGDVYSLPLLVTRNALSSEVFGESTSACPPSQLKTGSTTFTPAANNLTVHSKRNLKALENQKRQTNKPAEKSELNFEHRLLLGHVSMLTDVTLGEYQEKSYIITGDRDEHIRVSRDEPQAHIIERFCLGHKEFISRLCIPKERPELLISGGGDEDLLVWRWPLGELLSRVDLKTHVRATVENHKVREGVSVENDAVKVAVSGISHIRLPTGEDILTVICEGIPAVILFYLSPQNVLTHMQSLKLPGNALSVVLTTHDTESGSTAKLLVSIDTAHNTSSTTTLRHGVGAEGPIDSLRFYNFVQGQVATSPTSKFVSDVESAVETGEQRLANLLYNLENLRKREGDLRGDD